MAKNITISVIVPAYNEAKTITMVLKKLATRTYISQIIVVDDCSTDDTATKVKAVRSKKIRYLKQKRNQGKGAAITRGLSYATGKYTLIQDADLEYNPDEIKNLLSVAEQHKASVVFGSRFTGTRKNMFYWHMLGNKLLSFLVNILYNTTLSDMETCYKLIDTELFKSLNLKEKRFGIEPEITCKILKRKIFIYETPITYNGRTFEEGKKITWVDGFRAIYVILVNRLIM